MRHELQGRFPRVNLDLLFGTYDSLLVASGLVKKSDFISLESKDKPKKFKYKKTQIESFNVSEIDLNDLFEKAGNPEILRIVAQPDTHVAHIDQKAITAFMMFLKWYRPHGHIIMGDFLDAEGISHWENDSLKPREFIPEVVKARELLSQISEIIDPTCIFKAYLKGNHEDWINQAMASKLPTFFNGLDELGLMPDLVKLLDLEKFKYDFIDMNHILKIGKAHFTHGLYTGNNHPKKHLDVIKDNIYYGHLHDIASHQQPSIGGMIEAASLGCLCDIQAKFLKGKPNNWVHGFGIFEFFRNGYFSRYQIRIFNGSFSYNGKVFYG